MSVALHAVVALLAVPTSILIVGLIARLLATFFVNDREAKIAGFAFCFGMLSTSGSFKRTDIEGSPLFIALGAAIGLAVLYWIFFRRETQHG